MNKARQSEHSSLLNLFPGVCWKNSRPESHDFGFLLVGDPQVHSSRMQVHEPQVGLLGTCFQNSTFYVLCWWRLLGRWPSSVKGSHVASSTQLVPKSLCWKTAGLLGLNEYNFLEGLEYLVITEENAPFLPGPEEGTLCRSEAGALRLFRTGSIVLILLRQLLSYRFLPRQLLSYRCLCVHKSGRLS